MEVKIRDVDPVIVKKIDKLAKEQHMSRNGYLKHCLAKYAVVQDVEDLNSRYTDLVNLLTERLQQANDVIEANTAVLEKIMEQNF